MLFTSPVYSQTSGSIAGITYFHGRSGLATRARSTPTNPNTARQRTIRHAIARLGSYWGQTLSAGGRAAWNLYASNVPWVNALGQTTFLTGQQHFTRCNVPRLQASIDILDASPTIYDLGSFTAPTITSALRADQKVTIAYTNTDDWANADGGFLLLSIGRSVGPGVNYFKGPFRYTDKVVGAAEPPISPTVLNSPWPIFTDNKLWIMARFIQVDGRMSSPVIVGPKTIELF